MRKWLFFGFASTTIFYSVLAFAAGPAKAKNCRSILVQDLPAGVTYWGKYTCVNCGTKDVSTKPASDGKQSCPSCGKAHTNEDFYNLKTITENDIVKDDTTDGQRAKSGKKVACLYCGADMFKADSHCPTCGANQAEPPNTSDHGTPAARGGKSKWAWLAGTTIAALLGGGYWATSTKDIPGAVQSLSWEHLIHLQTFVEVGKENWCSDVDQSTPVMPVDGAGESAGAFDIRRVDSRIHHYDHILDHYDSVPRTEYDSVPSGTESVSNGNGSFTTRTTYTTVSRTVIDQQAVYRDDPVYAEWCEYKTYGWSTYRTLRENGGASESQANLPWPQVPTLGVNDRYIREENYKGTIGYTYKGQQNFYSQIINSESDFKSYRLMEPVILRKKNIGGTAEVVRASNK